jgi:ABC-type sugar transport system ATPase subunit
MRIAAERVCKRYETIVLDDCSLAVEAGGCLIIRGPSGGGKSTLLRILALLEPADSGAVVHGEQSWQPSEIGAIDPYPLLTLVFQQLFLWPHLTIAQNFSLVLSHRNDGVVSAECQALLDRLDIGHLLARRPHECSLGQRQRVAISRALLSPVRFLLLDEPSSALDRTSQQQVVAELAAAKRGGRGLVVVTHDERAFDQLADERLLLEGGRLRAL